MSRQIDWGVIGNRVLWHVAYCDPSRGFAPICTYEPGYRLPTDRSRLDRLLDIKRRVIAEAEEGERMGNPWEIAEFVEVLRELFTAEFEPALTAAPPAAPNAPAEDAPPETACTCDGLGECEFCKAWAREMLAVRQAAR